MKKVLGRIGQSTLEYVIVLTAIVAAILFAASQFIKPSVNKVYQEAGTTMNASSTLFSNAIGGGLNISTASTGATASATSSTSSSTTAVVPS